MDDVFLMTRTCSNEPFLEMPINHDIYRLLKKLTPRAAEPKRALGSSTLTRARSFVRLILFEATIVFRR
jgi:hypothetical protein